MRKNFWKSLPKLPFSVLVWAALAVVLLIGLVIAGQREQWPEDLVTTLRTLVVLLVGLRIIADIKGALARGRAELLAKIALGEDEPLEHLAWKDSVTGVYLIHILLYAGLVLLVIFAVGGTLSGFLVSGTLLSVMLGVAGQSFFANFFGGLAIAIFKPFELGDHVQLVAWQLPLMAETYPHETRAQGYRGFIRDINLFYSEVRLDDGRLLRIPNGVVINAGILRLEHAEWLRTCFRFDVPLDGGIEETLATIAASAARHFAPDEAGSGPEASPPPQAQAQAQAQAGGQAARPLHWHPPEVLVVDLTPTSAAVEVHASVLPRSAAPRKNEFFREVLHRLKAQRREGEASADS